jgi:hypothetical protein
MIFNKRAYFIPEQTKNQTNTKTFDSLENEFSFYAEFKLDKFEEEESLVIGRLGHHMGIFVQKPNVVKFTWYTEPDIYNDIWVPVDDIHKQMKILVSVSDIVKIYVNGELKGEKPKGNLKSYKNKNIYIGSISPYGESNPCWFNGEISKVCVFDKSVETFDENSKSLFLNFDFNNNSKFKTFDLSNNGNHGIYVENPEYASHSINEFNKIAPGARII